MKNPFKRAKIKQKKWTISDCRKYCDENPQYRYVIVVGNELTPIWICKTYEDAKYSIKSHLMCGGRLPVQILDMWMEYEWNRRTCSCKKQ